MIEGPKTWGELEALLPDAAIEENASGEIVIYTGLMVGEDLGQDKTLVGWRDPEELVEEDDDE